LDELIPDLIQALLNLRLLARLLLSSIWYPSCSMYHYLLSPHPLLLSSRQWMPIITAQEEVSKLTDFMCFLEISSFFRVTLI
jgi:hypothetical protein